MAIKKKKKKGDFSITDALWMKSLLRELVKNPDKSMEEEKGRIRKK